MPYTKIIKSGNLVEIYKYEKDLPERRILPRKKSVGRRTKRNLSRRIDNVKRLKRSFVRLVRSNLGDQKKPALFTFTMASCLHVKLGYECFTAFIQRMRRVYGVSFSYIAVPEFQIRGAVHFHALIWGLPEKDLIDEAPHWEREEDYGRMDKIKRGTRKIQNLWSYGYVDCVITDGSAKLASYLGKYMQKAMCDERLVSEKAYVASRNIVRPLLLPFTTALDYVDEMFPVESSIEFNRDFDTLWLGRCNYRSYLVDNES